MDPAQSVKMWGPSPSLLFLQWMKHINSLIITIFFVLVQMKEEKQRKNNKQKNDKVIPVEKTQSI